MTDVSCYHHGVMAGTAGDTGGSDTRCCVGHWFTERGGLVAYDNCAIMCLPCAVCCHVLIIW